MKQIFGCLFILALVLLFITSCKKKDEDETPPPVTPITYANYSKLKVGNYWVYERYNIDGDGNEVASAVFDSVYVEKDTVIDDQTYFKIMSPQYLTDQQVEFVRDSLHYTITSGGKILFSSQDFTTFFQDAYHIIFGNDTVAHIYRNTNGPPVSVSTPAGTFNALDARTTFEFWPDYDDGGVLRYQHIYYAEGIGPVIETLPFFAGSPNYVERRLVRYHVE